MQKITFKNKCSVPEWLPDYKKEFRANADSFFEKIIESVLLFKNKEVEISYFQQGVGSIVAKVELNDGERYVIKTTDRLNSTIAEIKSYKAMKDNNIKVPEVYSEGLIDDHPFFVMEYFKEKTLKDKLNDGEININEVAKIKAKVFVDLKKIRGTGFGWTIGYEGGILKGNFPDIESFMGEWFGNKGIVDVANKNYPSMNWREEFEKQKSLVINECENNESLFGSFDFQTAHFFATEPPTFFDSQPRLEPEYFDIASSMMPTMEISNNDKILEKALIREYENRLGPINKEKLFRAVWIQTFRKAGNLLLRPDERRTKLGLYMLDILSKKENLEEYIDQYF